MGRGYQKPKQDGELLQGAGEEAGDLAGLFYKNSSHDQKVGKLAEKAESTEHNDNSNDTSALYFRIDAINLEIKS